jgi:excisionase family DNA binding protein
MEKIILSSLSLEDIASQVAEKIYDLQKRNNEQKAETRDDEFLTIVQASELLNLARPTIYTLTHKSEIPFIKKGKKLYFKKADLHEWLNTGRRLTRNEIKKEADKYTNRICKTVKRL